MQLNQCQIVTQKKKLIIRFKIFLKIFKTNHTNEFKFKHSEINFRKLKLTDFKKFEKLFYYI